jgi:hypothetical protein
LSGATSSVTASISSPKVVFTRFAWRISLILLTNSVRHKAAPRIWAARVEVKVSNRCAMTQKSAILLYKERSDCFLAIRQVAKSRMIFPTIV